MFGVLFRVFVLQSLFLFSAPLMTVEGRGLKEGAGDVARSCIRTIVSLLPEPIQSRAQLHLRSTVRSLLGRSFYEKRGNIWKPDLKPFIPTNPIIIEAGAHVGYDTIEFKKWWPQSRVLAFEPAPKVFEKLVQNTRGLKGVESFKLALGSTEGWLTLNISEGSSDASSSLLAPKDHLNLFPRVTFPGRIDVEVVNMERWAQARGIQSVDLLWMDLQGYEFEALRNATNLLQRTRLIYTEVNLSEVYEGAVLYPDLRVWLEKLGFVVEKELAFSRGQGNVLFRNTKMSVLPRTH